MIVLRDPQQLTANHESQSTTLILKVLADSLQQRFKDMSDGDFYDPKQHGYMVIAEPGDEVSTLETETSCPIFTDWFHESRYGDDDFAPAFEWLDDLPFCYEMGFIANDSGFAIIVIVPKLAGIDAQLLEMCRENTTIA